VAVGSGKGSFQEAGGPRAYFGFPADASESEGHHLYSVLAEIFAAEARALLDSLEE